MRKIILASNNAHKLSELKNLLKEVRDLEVTGTGDFGIRIEVEEDGATLEENAFKKAKAVYDVLKIPTVSDDTGLFVDSLNGEPGVLAARYAGENAAYADNCKKLLFNLDNVPEEKRTARFESVICCYKNPDEVLYFKGICNGKILCSARGENGFGYDPLFVPDGSDKTFAEMTDMEKNKISHRAISMHKFLNHITSSSK